MSNTVLTGKPSISLSNESTLQYFDEIHVISDIHMGGKEASFQILKETERLKKFINQVARREAREVALVLNGDLLDTLAQETSGYVAIHDAVPVIQSIVENVSFRDIWTALGELARTPHRTLVIVLGNHDVELAFPPVQRYLLDVLAGDDAAARGRIQFSTSGGGFACMVGPRGSPEARRVYCTHGNEVDEWNFNRYEDLAKISRRLNAGEKVGEKDYTPNYGTSLVKDVMNDIKVKYPWVDLLKPETEAAISTLIAVAGLTNIDNKWKGVQAFMSMTANKGEHDKRLSAQASAAARGSDFPLPAEPQIGPHLLALLQTEGNDLYLAVEDDIESGRGKNELAEDGTLGWGTTFKNTLSYGWKRLTGVSPEKALQAALLDWSKEGDKSFDTSDKDETFQRVTARVGNDVDFVVTSHTHLERYIPLGGRRHYFNTGTWIRLLEFTSDVLSDAHFKEVYNVLNKGTLADIDALEINGKKFVKDCCSSVSIAFKDGQVVGELNHIGTDGQPIVQHSSEQSSVQA